MISISGDTHIHLHGLVIVFVVRPQIIPAG